MTLTQNKDYSISLVRLLATVFIVACHIMQYNDFVLAWWFNVGVQIFLCMSGFLYSKKEITNPLGFYKKQLWKILVDYYIVVLTASLLQFIFLPQKITLFRFAKAFFLYGTLSGGEHLWYIPYIILCYILTPVLASLMKMLYDKKSSLRLVLGSLLILLFSLVIFSSFFDYFNSAWVNCYIIGFILGFCQDKCKPLFGKLFIAISVVCVVMNFSQIYVEYFAKMQFSGAAAEIFRIFCDYAHVALGCFLFIALHLAFSVIFKKKPPRIGGKILDISDKLSYDVYLVHQFLILGPMSLMAITGLKWVNVIIIIVLILVLSLGLNYLSKFIRDLCRRKARNEGTAK